MKKLFAAVSLAALNLTALASNAIVFAQSSVLGTETGAGTTGGTTGGVTTGNSNMLFLIGGIILVLLVAGLLLFLVYKRRDKSQYEVN